MYNKFITLLKSLAFMIQAANYKFLHHILSSVFCLIPIEFRFLGYQDNLLAVLSELYLLSEQMFSFLFLKSAVFWNVILCSLVDVCQPVKGSCCVHHLHQ
jgi:hypothetical protein